MDAKLEKMVAMAGGQNRDDLDINKISLEIRGQIDGALESVFMGKSILKWVRGGTLGAAWESSLDELRDEIESTYTLSPETMISSVNETGWYLFRSEKYNEEKKLLRKIEKRIGVS